VLTDIYGGVQRADATAEIFFTVFLALALTDDSFFSVLSHSCSFLSEKHHFCTAFESLSMAMVVIDKVITSLSDFLTTYGRWRMRIRDSRR